MVEKLRLFVELVLARLRGFCDLRDMLLRLRNLVLDVWVVVFVRGEMGWSLRGCLYCPWRVQLGDRSRERLKVMMALLEMCMVDDVFLNFSMDEMN